MVEISFFLVGKSRGSAAAAVTAEVELAGKREVTRDRRPLCVITNRPARTVLFNRTKVQEVHTCPLIPHTSPFFSPILERNARRKKEVMRSKCSRARRDESKDVQIFERANDISRLGKLWRSNLRISPR